MAENKSGQTVLGLAAKKGELDSLLGVTLPESARKIVGDAWFKRNSELLREMGGKFTVIEADPESGGLDIGL